MGISMEKVTEVELSVEDAEQIVRIDKVLQKTAKLFFQHFIEKGECTDLFLERFEVKLEWIDDLEEQFRKSGFYSDDSIDVANAFDDAMYPLVPLNNEYILQVLYPVLFYTLVLKNYSNRDTVNRRARRGSKSWGIKKNMLKVPPAGGDCKNKEAIASARRKIEALGMDVIQKRNELEQRLINEDEEYLRLSLRELDDLLMHADNVMYILDDKRISWLKTMAQRAMFAQDILLSQIQSGPPIDTLLRLYLLNEIDRVVFYSEYLSNDGRHNHLTQEYLLTSFWENRGIPIENIFSPNEIQKLVRTKRKVSLAKEEPISDEYTFLYEQLSKLQIEDEDIEEMLDYFFAPSKLAWYQKLEDEVIKFADVVIEGLRKCENIDERHNDWDNFLTLRLMQIFEVLEENGAN